jgi:hypothetical protein
VTKCSFFVTTSTLLTSPFYNPASASGREQVRTIVALGHSVGLHFDATVYGSAFDVVDFNKRSSEEARQLESIAGVSVGAISFHRPAPLLLGAGPELTTPRVHTYLPRYVQEMEYCSDSTGVWRFGPPDEREAIARGRAMHLLTHPEWWGDEDISRVPRLWGLLKGRAEQIKKAVPEELGIPVEADGLG